MSVSTASTDKYDGLTSRSSKLYTRAREVFPSGITHDSRYLKPHPVFIERASGSRKWDVDGTEYVDYFGGHGSLILGHNHPEILEAVNRQLARGTHFGASHELELEWGELVKELVPCAERVRFTSSGTEATQLGFRLARAATGKKKILRFDGHFHGWHDQVSFGQVSSPGDLPAGIPSEISDLIVVCPPNDLDTVSEHLSSDDDVAAVVLEPTGATFGHVPTSAEFLRGLRSLTQEHGVLLIFDEVISGFRVSPGGAQGHFGVTPDLAFLAKILAGGLPGGAVVGRSEIMGTMEMTREERVAHYGTYNANPLSAAAGVAALKQVREGRLTARANETAAAIRDGMNSAIQELGLGWVVYGEFSDFHIFANHDEEAVTVDDIYSGKVSPETLKGGTPASVIHKIRTGMFANGVDVISWPGGLVSAVHTEEDVELTVSAFRKFLAEVVPVAAG